MRLQAALVILGISGLVSAGRLTTHEEMQTGVITCLEVDDLYCVLDMVKILKNEPPVQYKASAPENMISTKFVDSKVEQLSRELCDKFPNTETISLVEAGLEIIDDDAFENCHKLVNLDVSNNSLTSLAPDLFLPLVNLRYLVLRTNRLTEITNDHLRSLRSLMFVHVEDNYLRQFPASALAPLRELIGLMIHTNELTDVDARGIVANRPNLLWVEFNNNPIGCRRVKEIEDYLQENDISAYSTYFPRERPFEMEKICTNSSFPTCTFCLKDAISTRVV